MKDADLGKDLCNFDLEIASNSDGTYRVKARFGEKVAASKTDGLPQESEISRWISDVETYRGSHAEKIRSDPTKSQATEPTVATGSDQGDEPASEDDRGSEVDTTRGSRLAPDVELPSLTDLGQGLFDKLLCIERREGDRKMDSPVSRLYEEAVATAETDHKELRVRLFIQAPELSRLPWEYVYDQDKLRNHLVLAQSGGFLRRPKTAVALNPEPASLPLKILGMIALPKEVSKLKVEDERDLVNKAMKDVDTNVTVTWLDQLAGSRSGQTKQDLRNAMADQDADWHIFHFIGHGGFDEKTQEGYLVLSESDDMERAYRLPATQLAEYLKQQKSLKLVVLNSCEGARASERAQYSSVASHLARVGIPAVISMQHEITDKAAMEFSRTLYGEIARGIGGNSLLRIDKIMARVRDDLLGTTEWATPVLHSSTEHGCLLYQDLRGAVDPPKKPRPAPAPVDIEDSDRVLGTLHTTVSRWLEGELKKSKLAATLEELGIEASEGCVSSPTGDELLSAAGSMTDIFEEAGGQLLILGEAGTGKTRFMLRMVQQLMADWEKDPSLRLPVPVKLSTWTPDEPSLVDFLAARMVKQGYRTSRSQNEQLISEGLLCLALDGLDEVPAEHRAACLEAINEFADDFAGFKLMVTSRFAEYAELFPTKLVAGGAVRLQRLTREGLLGMLESGGPELSALRDLVGSEPAWAALAETPALLAMLVEGFRGETLEEKDLSDFESRIREVMAKYEERGWAQAS